MQKVLNLTNNYLILATPLILYSLFSSLYLVLSANGGKVINLLFAILLFFLMTGAFFAGWFNMIKLAVTVPDIEDPNSLIKDFPAGVGEFFLPSLGAISIIFLIMIITLTFSYYIGMNFIGDPEVSTKALTEAFQNTATLKAFLSGLTIEQLTKLNLWNMLILGTLTFAHFLVMLYFPALFFINKNPLKALFIGLKDLFSRHIIKNCLIFLLIFTLNFIISVLSAFFAQNALLHFIITLLNFYFITATGVGIFYYYHTIFIKQKIGQNVDIKI